MVEWFSVLVDVVAEKDSNVRKKKTVNHYQSRGRGASECQEPLILLLELDEGG